MDLNLKLALNVIPWLKVPVALTQPHCFKVAPNLNGVFRASCRVPKWNFSDDDIFHGHGVLAF